MTKINNASKVSNLSLRSVWLTISWMWLFVIIVFSLITVPDTLNIKISQFDKVEHFFSYFVLMFLFAQCYNQKSSRLIYGAVFIAIGVVLEILQSYSVTRLFEYTDMVANSTGVIFGLLLDDGILQKYFIKIDNILSRCF